MQSNTAVTFRPDDSTFSYPIAAKEIPANLGRLGRSPQDTVEPVISGPSKHREPLVEIASPYHIEAYEENISDTVERSSQQAAPHSLLEHSGSETDASVALQPSTGAVVTNTTTDVEPVIPGPSKHREPLVEIASHYQVEKTPATPWDGHLNKRRLAMYSSTLTRRQMRQFRKSPVVCRRYLLPAHHLPRVALRRR